MKNLILILLLIACWISADLYSQDTSIIKYLPLNVGNTWVYNFNGLNPPTGKTRITVSNTEITNGHIYYVLTQSGPLCGCSFYVQSPFLITLAPFRIDSLSGNILLKNGNCPWHPNESILDSLKTRIGDNVQNTCNNTYCVDTNTMNIFGTSRKTKYVGLNIMTWFSFRRYAKDIGLYSAMQGCYLNTSCTYNLQGCVINGIVYGDTSYPLGINKISSEVPEEFSLYQNYPNPFNPDTHLRFEISDLRFVKITVYDLLGSEVETLVNEQLSPGTYEVEFDGTSLASGVYYYVLTAGDPSALLRITNKMVLLK